MSPKWARIAAAFVAVLLIGIAIAATSGGRDDSTRTATGAGAQLEQTAADPHAAHSEIYVVHTRTRRVKRLTEFSGEGAQQPAWAPNRRIVFSASVCDECYPRLFHVDGRGINEVLIDTSAKRLFYPTWAPGGDRLAAVALGRGIYSISLRQRAARRLTSGRSDEAPAWSPKGNWIAFDKQVSGSNYDLFAVNAVTRRVKRLTRGPSAEINPGWSPDGSRIVFAHQQANGKWAIFTMKADGSGRRRVTPSGLSAQEPAWAPDGRHIAFIKQKLDQASIAIVRSDGRGNIRQLTGKPLFPAKPAWSPDGESIVFSGTKGQASG